MHAHASERGELFGHFVGVNAKVYTKDRLSWLLGCVVEGFMARDCFPSSLSKLNMGRCIPISYWGDLD